MASEFVFWAGTTPTHVAQLSGLVGFEHDFHINQGISHANDFPEGSYFGMDPDYPNDTLLADQLCNTNSFTVVSKRVQEFLASKKLKGVELLNVKVLDHKKRDVGAPFYIVNAVGTISCLDRSACNIIEEDEFRIQQLGKLVIDPEKIPADRKLFRIENLARYLCVRRDLAQAIDKLEATGIRWVEPEELEGDEIPSDLSSLPPRDED